MVEVKINKNGICIGYYLGRITKVCGGIWEKGEINLRITVITKKQKSVMWAVAPNCVRSREKKIIDREPKIINDKFSDWEPKKRRVNISIEEEAVNVIRRNSEILGIIGRSVIQQQTITIEGKEKLIKNKEAWRLISCSKSATVNKSKTVCEAEGKHQRKYNKFWIRSKNNCTHRIKECPHQKSIEFIETNDRLWK